MNLGSWIVLSILALCVALAIRSIIKNRKAGKNRCGGCTGCSGGAVPTSCSAAKRMVAEMERAARH